MPCGPRTSQLLSHSVYLESVQWLQYDVGGSPIMFKINLNEEGTSMQNLICLRWMKSFWQWPIVNTPLCRKEKQYNRFNCQYSWNTQSVSMIAFTYWGPTKCHRVLKLWLHSIRLIWRNYLYLQAYPFKIDWKSVYREPAQPLVVDIGSGKLLMLLRTGFTWWLNRSYPTYA